MKRLVIHPDGWPCKFAECRPGYFLFMEALCLKTEYGDDAYCESGEAFWGGVSSKEDRAGVIVQPVYAAWEEYEE